MGEYRQMFRAYERDTWWTMPRAMLAFAAVIVFLFILGFGLHSLGLWGGTAVERKVFEQSYQRSEAMKARIATDEAALAEIEGQLRIPGLDPQTRARLQAQASAARSRINAARAQQ